MLGLFKKKAKKAVTAIQKMDNRDAVEATVWGGYYISFYDGECSAEEIAVLNKTVNAVPAFNTFAGEIATLSENARAQFEASKRRAGAEALRKLEAIAGTSDAVDVLCLCIDIADQDGIGKEEEEALGKIAAALQVPLAKYL